MAAASPQRTRVASDARGSAALAATTRVAWDAPDALVRTSDALRAVLAQNRYELASKHWYTRTWAPLGPLLRAARRRPSEIPVDGIAMSGADLEAIRERVLLAAPGVRFAVTPRQATGRVSWRTAVRAIETEFVVSGGDGFASVSKLSEELTPGDDDDVAARNCVGQPDEWWSAMCPLSERALRAIHALAWNVPRAATFSDSCEDLVIEPMTDAEDAAFRAYTTLGTVNWIVARDLHLRGLARFGIVYRGGAFDLLNIPGVRAVERVPFMCAIALDRRADVVAAFGAFVLRVMLRRATEPGANGVIPDIELGIPPVDGNDARTTLARHLVREFIVWHSRFTDALNVQLPPGQPVDSVCVDCKEFSADRGAAWRAAYAQIVRAALRAAFLDGGVADGLVGVTECRLVQWNGSVAECALNEAHGGPHQRVLRGAY